MLVVMEAGARPEQIEAIVRHVERMGLKAHPIPGANRTAIGITGAQGGADPEILETFPGVKEVIRVSHAYKLVSREAKPKTPTTASSLCIENLLKLLPRILR